MKTWVGGIVMLSIGLSGANLSAQDNKPPAAASERALAGDSSPERGRNGEVKISVLDHIRLDAIPHELTVRNTPESIQVVAGRTLKLAAKAGTNLFRSPNGSYIKLDAPMVLFKPDGDFVLAARVSGNLKNVYDVAALVIYQDDNCWAKLCYENSVAKEATIVSVITKDYSDDCNSVKTDSAGAFLAIEKKGPELSFHYSRDGRTWALIRHFRMELKEEFKIGFAVHGSRGDGFAASFSDIVYSTMPSQNMRQLEISVTPSSS